MRIYAVLLFVFTIIGFHAQVAISGIDDGLVIHYPISGNADDASGNGNHGIVNGAVLVEDRCGTPQGAYEFSGSDYIESIRYVGITGNQPRSISAWISPHQYPGPNNHRIIQEAVKWGIYGDLDGYERIPYLSCLGTRQNGFFFWGWHSDLQGTPQPVAQWHHVVFTYDGKVGRIYANGVLDVEANFPPDPDDPPNERKPLETVDSSLKIGGAGHRTTGAPFAGIIDEVRIYNRALTGVEIQELYNFYYVPTYICGDFEPPLDNEPIR